MNKIDCDIIKDLLPSYMDKICSDATKRCVEEHLETCADCRQTAMLCKNNTFSGDKLNQQSLDGLQKIRKKIKVQNFISFVIFMLMTYIGIWMFVIRKNIPSFFTINVLCGICIAAILCAYIGYKGKRKPGKTEYILGAISLATDIWLAAIALYIFQKIKTAQTLPNAEITQLGQAFLTQLMVCFVLQIAYFFYILVCTLKQDKNCSLLACLNIMGIFLLTKYYLCMVMMDSLETLVQRFQREVLVILGIGLLGMAASVLIPKYQQRKKESFSAAHPKGKK